MFSRLAFAGAAALAAVAMPSLAQAGTCEDTFVKRGNGITGLRFVAMTSVVDMPVDVAINQMRGIVAKRGYSILAVEPAGGAMLIEQAQTGTTRAFPIEITATVNAGGVGTVTMEAKPRSGQFIKADDAKAEMCAVLAELKGGKEGRQLAKAGAGATTVQAAPVAMTAQAFSQQLSKDAERNAAAIPMRYNGQRYTLSGDAETIRKDGDRYWVSFQIQQPHEMAIRLPGMASTISEVVCYMAPGTSVFVLQLKPGKGIKLTGTYDEFSESRDIIYFKDCTPAAK